MLCVVGGWLLAHHLFFNHEAEVYLARPPARSCGYHLTERGENFCRHAALPRMLSPTRQDDGFASLIFHIGERLQVGCDGRDGFAGIHSQRDADLRWC